MKANAIPAGAFVIYDTDLTLFRFEYLGAGIPPADPHTKTRLGRLERPGGAPMG